MFLYIYTYVNVYVYVYVFVYVNTYIYIYVYIYVDISVLLIPSTESTYMFYYGMFYLFGCMYLISIYKCPWLFVDSANIGFFLKYLNRLVKPQFLLGSSTIFATSLFLSETSISCGSTWSNMVQHGSTWFNMVNLRFLDVFSMVLPSFLQHQVPLSNARNPVPHRLTDHLDRHPAGRC